MRPGEVTRAWAVEAAGAVLRLWERNPSPAGQPQLMELLASNIQRLEPGGQVELIRRALPLLSGLPIAADRTRALAHVRCCLCRGFGRSGVGTLILLKCKMGAGRAENFRRGISLHKKIAEACCQRDAGNPGIPVFLVSMNQNLSLLFNTQRLGH